MTARILTGSKQEIARQLAELEGEVREAIVFVEEPSAAAAPSPLAASPEELFAEMEPYVVRVGRVDHSREVIYERAPGE